MRSLPVLALCLVIPCTWSQDSPSVAPPKFPISLHAPKNSAWTVSSSRTNKTDEDKTPYVKSLSVTKSGPIYHEIAEVTDGPSWEKWVFILEGEPLQLIKFAESANWKRMPRTGAASEWSNYAVADFEEFQWVSEQNYKGVETIDERPVYRFETTTKGGPLTRKESLSFDYGKAAEAMRKGESYGTNRVVSASFDARKSLPVRIDTGAEVRDYVFGEPPKAQLQPPPEVLAELTKWVAEIRSTQR